VDNVHSKYTWTFVVLAAIKVEGGQRERHGVGQKIERQERSTKIIRSEVTVYSRSRNSGSLQTSNKAKGFFERIIENGSSFYLYFCSFSLFPEMNNVWQT